jgi:hypothetical protein
MEDFKMELYHHGILKQEWGVRNGPPYPLSNSQKSSAEKRAEKPKKSKKSIFKTKKQSNVERDQEKAALNRGKLSDEELAKRISRLESEIKLRDLTEKNLHPGRKKVKEILGSTGGKVVTTIATGAALFAAKVFVSGKYKEWKNPEAQKQIRNGLAEAMFNGGPKKKN